MFLLAQDEPESLYLPWINGFLLFLNLFCYLSFYSEGCNKKFFHHPLLPLQPRLPCLMELPGYSCCCFFLLLFQGKKWEFYLGFMLWGGSCSSCGWRLYISYKCPYAQRVWITRNCKVIIIKTLKPYLTVCVCVCALGFKYCLILWISEVNLETFGLLSIFLEAGVAGQDRVGSYWSTR